MDLSYILNHLGEEEDGKQPVVPPIYQTSNFAFYTVEELRNALQDERGSILYTRGNTPTTNILRQKLSALAGSEDALIFSSGVAAISAAVLSHLKAGDHAICIKKPYSWTNRLFTEVLPGFGIETEMISFVDAEDLEPHLQENTRLIFLESPNTFTFEIQDLRSISGLARSRGILTMIDNSFSTPIGQRCIELGIDVELHSASKYLGGHSDLVSGLVLGSSAFIDKVFKMGFLNLGGIPSPHDAWLMLRSLRTLPIRMKQIESSASEVMQFLRNHYKVESLHHPFMPNHPQGELAKSQMSFGGGLFSIQLATDSPASIENFCNSLKRFRMAVSWGGHESLQIPSIALVPKEKLSDLKVPVNLVRLYVGLEEPGSLIEDLEQALRKI
jgi:cystathionine beta-lyase/cystathionine gamma-synthase